MPGEGLYYVPSEEIVDANLEARAAEVYNDGFKLGKGEINYALPFFCIDFQGD